MAYYVVQYLYVTDADLVAKTRPDHRAYLRTLVDAGTLKASGPYVGTERDSANLIFCAGSAAEVKQAIAADPMSVEGALESFTVTEWNPILGVFAS